VKKTQGNLCKNGLWSLKSLSRMLTASPYLLGVSSLPSDFL